MVNLSTVIPLGMTITGLIGGAIIGFTDSRSLDRKEIAMITLFGGIFGLFFPWSLIFIMITKKP